MDKCSDDTDLFRLAVLGVPVMPLLGAVELLLGCDRPPPPTLPPPVMKAEGSNAKFVGGRGGL